MELLIQNLPSGADYKFDSIHIDAMTFAKVLEYIDNVPRDPVEKYYFDYCTLKSDDPNVSDLLLPDLEYCVFIKKVLSITRNSKFTTTVKCPVCGASITKEIRIPEDVHFSPIDERFLRGVNVEVGGKMHEVRVPTVTEFMSVFQNYRRLKRITDMKLIRLISLFRNVTNIPNYYESLVVNATYEDITILTMLSQLFYEIVDPVTTYCKDCNKGETDVTKMRGIEVGIDTLISDFFRDIILNNRVDESKIIFREVRKF